MNVTDLFKSRPDETEFVLSTVSGEVTEEASVVLNREHTLALYGKNMLLHRFVCSPCALGALCTGWLFTEGYTADAVEISPDGHTATVQGISPLPVPPKKKSLSTPAGVRTEQMLALFHQASDKYSRSRGIHECVIKGNDWHILQTDIGRHNAIDKAVGTALMAGYDLRDAVMFTSGRINRQTVQKAAQCEIGCLMSKAVITYDALLLAQELGLKVFFSVKENSYNCI